MHQAAGKDVFIIIIFNDDILVITLTRIGLCMRFDHTRTLVGNNEKTHYVVTPWNAYYDLSRLNYD